MTASIMEKKCAICFDDFSTEKPAVTIQNETQIDPHSFHPECIQNWINARQQSNARPNCPLCRANITHVNGVEIPEQQQPRPITLGHHPLFYAAMDDQLDNVTEILEQPEPINIDHSALTTAMMVTSSEIRTILLRSPHVPFEALSEHLRGHTLVNLIRDNYSLENLQLLLNRVGPIPSRFRGQALVCAAELGNAEGVNILLDNGPISITQRIEAAWKSREAGHHNISSVLCRDPALVRTASLGLAVLGVPLSVALGVTTAFIYTRLPR